MVYRPPSGVIERRLVKAFPEKRLRELARTTGLVERRRKLDAAALFWVLTLGFAVGEDRSIEAFRQSYLQFVGGEFSLTYASFHGWFVESLTVFSARFLTMHSKIYRNPLIVSMAGSPTSAMFSSQIRPSSRSTSH